MTQSPQDLQIGDRGPVIVLADKEKRDKMEQGLRIEELNLKVRDLKKSDWRKIGTWTGLIAIAAAVMGIIGQGIVYNIKSAKASQELDSALERKKIAVLYADNVRAHLKLTQDSILAIVESSRLEFQNYQANTRLAKISLDSLKTAIAKIPFNLDNMQINKLNLLLKDTRQTLNTQIETSPMLVKNNDSLSVKQQTNISSPNPSISLPVDPNDPQKGQWGGQAERNYRRISATVQNIAGHLYKVVISVSSTDPAKRLTGNIIFHLHNTFRHKNPAIEVEENEAVLTLNAYGSFTVGAEADNGKTRLEFDLINAKGADNYFIHH